MKYVELNFTLQNFTEMKNRHTGGPDFLCKKKNSQIR